MRVHRVFCGVVVLASGLVASASAQTGVSGGNPPASAGTSVTAALTGTESQSKQGVAAEEQEKKAEKQAEQKEEQAKGLRFVWADRPSLRAGSWLRVDFVFKLQADMRKSDQDLTAYGGEFEVARRRAGIKGEITKFFEFEVVRDLTADGLWRDVYLNFRPFTAVQLQAGKFKVPFSLDQTTSATDLDFLFRSLAANALTPGREVGVMAHGSVFKKSIRYEAGYFRADGDNLPGIEPYLFVLPGEAAPVQGSSMAGRVRVAPFRELVKKQSAMASLEAGVAATSSTLPDGPNSLQGKTVFGYHFFPRHYYVSGRRLRLGTEFSWSPGPASVRFEYLKTEDQRLKQGVGNEQGADSDLPEIVGRGWYVTGTWAITGEKKDGGIVPRKELFRGGIGAVEVAARYEELRFGSTPKEAEPPSHSKRAANVEGNSDKVLTVGVNWYVNRWVKIQVNAIRETIEDATRSPIAGQSKISSYLVRFQFAM